MKNILFILLSVLLFSCQKDNSSDKSNNSSIEFMPSKFSNIEKEILKNFFTSNEYTRVTKETLQKIGKLDINLSSIEYVDNNKDKIIIATGDTSQLEPIKNEIDEYKKSNITNND